MGDRQEYVPGRRAASAGRQRPLSAQPGADNRFGNLALRQGRPMSAAGRALGAGVGAAWAEGGDGLGLGAPPKRVHAQALAGAKGKEQLAEDVVQLREQVSMLREHLNTQKVEKRRIEAELIRTRQGLLKSEELLNNKERVMSPTIGISQLYRTPDTTQLVANLKQQNVELRAANSRLDGEVRNMQRSVRATKVAELQAELLTANQELDRLARISQVATERMAAAEANALAAKAAAAQARDLAQRYAANTANGDGGLDSPGPKASPGTLRRTLQNMHQAHKTLQHEAEQLRSIFPAGLSMSDFTALARQQPNTAGAPDVLNFLRNHMAKLTSELSGQPGAPSNTLRPSTEGGVDSPRHGRSTIVGSPAKVPPPPAGPKQVSCTLVPDPVSPADLLPAVAAGVRKLRTLSEKRWRESPPTQIAAQELADVMQLYVDEVRRLQGKPPLSEDGGSGSTRDTQVKNSDLENALSGTVRAREEAKLAAADTQAARDELQQAKRDLDEANKKAAAAKKKEDELKAQLASLQQTLKDTQKTLQDSTQKLQTDTPTGSAPAAPATPDTAPYKVVVHTGTESGGAFDGKVWVTLYGSGYNTSGEIQLPSDRYSFDSGNADEFTIQVPLDCIPEGMAIESVGLRMGESEIGDVTWHVIKVEVTAPKGTPRTFWFEDWLKAGPVNRLFPRVPTTQGNADYEIEVSTADARGAGTEGQVYITVVGDQGMAPEVLLTPAMLISGGGSDTMFARGSTDTLKFSAADVGDVSHLIFRLAAADKDAAPHTSWYLSYVKLIHTGTGWGSMFYHWDWLTSTTEPRVTLTEGWTWQDRAAYTVKVVTSDLPGADFQGAAHITVHGYWGSTTEALLVAPKAKSKDYAFKRGTTDTFELRFKDVGPLSSVQIRTEPTSEDDVTWNIDRVVVTPADDPSAEAVFNFNQWVNGASSVTAYKDTAPISYKISVVPASDTPTLTSSMYVVLEGQYGSCTEVQLVNDSCAGGNDNLITFQPGGVQEFVVKERDVGALKSVTLRAAKVSSAATWKLDRMQVTVADNTKPVTFSVTSALEATTDGGSLTLPRFMTPVEYKVTVVTCESPEDAGFDGQVFIKLTGVDGTSEEVQLTSTDNSSPFSIGSTANLTFTAGDVGAFSYIEVRLNQTGSANWWRPNRFEITNTGSGQLGVFRYDSWMNTWNSWGYTVWQQSLTNYKIRVHATSTGTLETLGLKGSTLSSKLYVQLHSWWSASEEVEVPVPEGGLKPGDVAELVGFKCAVSWANSVSLRTEGGQKVHVRMVELVNEAAGGASNYYQCNNWVEESAQSLGYCEMVSYSLTLHTHRTKGALPAGARLFLSLAPQGSDTPAEEVEVSLPDGCAAGSSVTATAQTFRVYDIGQLKLRVAGAQSGTWGLQRATLEAGSLETFYNQSSTVQFPGTASLVKLPLQQYRITLNTSDRRGADADGDVTVRMVGDKGETADLRMTLGYPDTDAWDGHALSRGCTDTFTVRAPDVGKLKEVVVGLVQNTNHDQLRSAWHLNTLTVLQGDSGQETQFKYDNWIDSGSEATIVAGDSTNVFADYEVSLVTGYTGVFNGDLQLKLYDDYGNETHKVTLKKDDGKQDDSNPDVTTRVFKFRATQLNSISKCDFELLSGGCDYYAKLERLMVVCKANRAAALFKMQTWQYTWYGSSSYTAASADLYCQAVLRTKNFPDAGFDGAVYLTLHGEEGDTPEAQAHNWWCSSFDPDSTTYCSLYIPDVGQINAVSVRLDPTGSKQKWDLDYVDLNVWSKNMSGTFECSQAVQAGSVVRLKKRKQTTKYEITAVTSDLRGAGTDGAVYIQLYGDNGYTEEMQLFDSPEDFARNNTHTFKVSALEVGEIQNIYIKLDAPKDSSSRPHSAWHMAKVDVLNMTSGLKCTFNANKWINPEDGWVYLTQSSTEQCLQTYRVQVYTSSLPGASFDGQAYIKLSGWSGTTDEVQLVQSGRSTASFSAGSVQEFTIKASDIGSYTSSCTLRMVPTTSDPKWNVDKVVIIPDRAGSGQSEFYYNNWLTQDTTEATLYSQSAPTSYHVLLAVSADAGAAWDGQTYITFNGQWSSSDSVELVNNNTAYEPGVAQEFDLEATNIGFLTSVDLRVAGGSTGRTLKLDRVEVTLKETGKKMDFVPKEAISPEAGSQRIKAHLKECDYKVALVTDANSGNSTSFDGDTYLTLVGSDGQSDEIKLALPNDGGRPILSDGSSVVVDFKSVEVGPLSYIMLRMDFCGSCCEYKLSSLELTQVLTGVTTRAMCGSYLYSWCSTAYCYPQTTTTYKIKVTTGAQSFDGAVYLKLGSWYTEGKEVLLANDKGKDAFASGAVEEFTVSVSDLSYVSKVTLRVEASGESKQWDCALVEVVDAACTTASPTGFPINATITPDAPATRDYAYSNRWDDCSVRMEADSGPFNGGLWITMQDSNGQNSNEVAVLAPGSQVLEAGASVSLGAVSAYISSTPAKLLVRADQNTASSGTDWKPKSITLSTQYGSMTRYEPSSGSRGSSGALVFDQVPEVSYEVAIKTKDIAGNGTDGVIHVMLEGEAGASAVSSMYGEPERGSTDTQTFTLPDLGKLKSITLYNKDRYGESVHSQWCVESVEVTQTTSGVKSVFKCQDSAGGDLWVERGASVTCEVADTVQAYVDYKITIHTASGDCSGFDGDVRFKMEGDDCKQTAPVALGKGSLESGPFKPGGADVFNIKAVPMTVSHVYMDLSYNGSTSSWEAQRVVVERLDTKEVWLFKATGTLYAWNWYPEVPPMPMVWYNCQSYTGTVDKSVYDGDVYLTLVGSEGESKETKLGIASYEMGPGANGYNWMQAYSVGRLEAIKVRCEGGSVPRWNLANLKITDDTTSATAMFECSTGIKAGQPATLIKRTVTKTKYEVTVYTMDTKGAGTDGEVYCKLSGPNGETEEVLLRNGDEDFKRAAVDKFTIEGADVGESPTVQLRLASPATKDGDSTAPSVHSGWALDKVEVLNATTGVKGTYNYSAWLSMPSACTSLTQSSSVQALNKYQVKVTTGHLPGAGFDGKVFLDMDGWWASVKDVQLIKPGETSGHFADGSTVEFEVYGEDMGRVTNITVRFEPTEEDPAWNLDKIEITNGDYTSTFHYNSWLNMQQRSDSIYVNNPPGEYKVSVHTTDQADAAFDGEAFLVFTGADGTTEDILLTRDDFSHFAPASTEVFTLKAANVGTLRQCAVRIVGNKKEKKWHLDKIEVQLLPSDGSEPAAASVFPHRNWVEADTVTLEKLLPTTEYKITVGTGSSADAAFDGDVYITINGDDGSTEEVKLTLPSTTQAPSHGADAKSVLGGPAPSVPGGVAKSVTGQAPAAADGGNKTVFAAGSSLTFPVPGKNVGKISTVSVRLESSTAEGAATSWFLETLTVLEPTSGAQMVFPHKSYLYSGSSQTLYMPSFYNYTIRVYTSDQQGADFDGNLVLKLATWWDESKEEVLSATRTSSGAFKPGSCEEFTLKVDNICWVALLKLRAEKTPESKESRWHCSHVEVVQEGCDPLVFHVHDWVPAGETFRDCERTMMTDYTVTLFMSPAKAGDTINLDDLVLCATPMQGPDQGDPAAWAEAQLTLSPAPEVTASLCMPEMTAYTATFRAPVVDGFARMQLKAKAGSSGNAASWVLDRLKVFDNYSWNTKLMHLGASLSAGGPVRVASVLENATYDVTLVTADLRGNGHDGSVSVLLEGLQALSEEVELNGCNILGDSTNMFERGSTDTFRMYLPDLGKLRTLGIKLSGSSHSQWWLDRVDVVNATTGMLTSFPCNKWVEPLGPDQSSTGAMSVKLSPEGEPKPSFVEWTVTTWTSAMQDAAYDGEVSVQLYDSQGRNTMMTVLGVGSTDSGAFQIAAKNVFRIQAPPLADVSKVVVRMIDKANSSTWRVDRVEALCEKTGAAGRFTHHGLIRSYDWDTTLEEEQCVEYEAEFTTGPGNDYYGHVYLVLYGSSGRTKEIPMMRWGDWPHHWAENSRTIDFSAYGVGAIKALGLRTQTSDDKFPLESVKVTNKDSGASALFMWGAAATPSKKLQVVKKKTETTNYLLEVYTADYRGAGTDADVYASLCGDEGEVEEWKLSSGKDQFNRGSKDKFKFSGPVLGPNASLTFRLAPPAGASTAHSAWQLGYCSLYDLNTGMRTQFYHWSWVHPGVPTKLDASWTCKGLYPYAITVKTGDTKGADFSGEVWVKLCGWWGETDELLLAPDGQDKHTFRAGATDAFTLKADDIGSITSLQIVRLVPTDSASSRWQLGSVEVVASESGNSFLFEHDNWVSASDTNVTLYRSMPNIPYKVTVYTAASSPVPQFSKELLITMRGMFGSCDENRLVNDSTAPRAPGSKEEYDLKDSDLGALSGLILGIKAESEDDPAPTWLVDRLDITNVNTGSIATFPYVNSSGSPVASWQLLDGKWILDLPRQLPETDYAVAVTTTDLPDATFDGDVLIIITGSEGSTAELRLPADTSKAYNPGQTDSFTIRAADVGALQSVAVSIKQTAAQTQWHLTEVAVTKGGAGGAPCKFPCKAYLNQYNSSTTLYQQGTCKYSVTLVTTDTPEAAGFSGSVYLTLNGQYGSGAEVKLVPANQPPSDAAEAIKAAAAKEAALEPGNSAAYTLECADMGVVTGAKVRLERDDSSKLDKWHCAKIIVRSERDPGSPFVLPLNDWIQVGEAKAATLSAKRLVTYNTDIVLAADQDTASGATLAITLTGPTESGVSETVEVKPPSGTWQPGVNSVTFEATELSSITSATVKALKPTDGTDAPGGVSLVQLKMTDSYSWTTTAFWRPANAPALQQGGDAATLEVLQDVTYKITVVTGDKRGAGTDGSVTLTLTGDKGSTAELSLSNDWWSNFERGRTDTFEITAADVGVIKSAKIGVSSSANSGWLLSSLSVVNPGSGLQHDFKCEQWLGSRDSSCSVELTDSTGGKKV